MKNIKIKYILILIVCTAIAVSCDDFLEEAAEPLDRVGGENFFNTEARVTTGLLGIYSELYTYRNAGDIFRYIENRSDNGSENNTDSDDVSAFNQNRTSPTGLIWDSNYRIISRANLLLADIENNFSESERTPNLNRLTGEARFLRAFAYFNLIVIYGDIPLLLEQPFDRDTAVDLTRSPVSIVFEQAILPDLQFAMENCYTRSELEQEGNLGNITLSAAKVLLAEAYLNLERFDEAETLAEEVIASGEYGLVTDFSSLYGDGADNNPESIWEIQFNFGANGISNNLMRLFPFDLEEASLFDAPAAFGVPTRDLLEEMEDDPRFNVSLDSGLVSLIDGRFINARFWKKYHDFSIVGNVIENDWNIKMIRLADAYHMAAEAEIQQGKEGEAFAHLNVLRQRVGLPNLSAADVTGGMDALDLYLNERRMEFAGEMKRWRDLKRTGRAIEIMEAYRSDVEGVPVSIPSTKLVFPIPESEIQANPNLTQNPGY